MAIYPLQYGLFSLIDLSNNKERKLSQDLRNDTNYSGIIFKMTIFCTIYSGTA